MKTIIIEGTDRTGKSSLIKGICDYYEYDNVIVRHCGKPPKHIPKDAVYQWQMSCFIKEGNLAAQVLLSEFNEHKYYENKIIYNRYYLGEYVYGIMFRDYKKEFISHRLNEFEKQFIDQQDTYLITMAGDPVFLLSQEDGNSFSQNIDQKTQEIELFKEIHEKSIIENKLFLKVDNGIGEYLPKQQLLDTTLNFINGKK
jgi:thymidylate kinase